MKKKCALKRLVRAIKGRPVLALRYRYTTALYCGDNKEEPSRVTAHKGRIKIDFLSLIATFITVRIALKALIKHLQNKRRKK